MEPGKMMLEECGPPLQGGAALIRRAERGRTRPMCPPELSDGPGSRPARVVQVGPELRAPLCLGSPHHPAHDVPESPVRHPFSSKDGGPPAQLPKRRGSSQRGGGPAGGRKEGERMTHEEEAAKLAQCTVSIWEALAALEAAAQATIDEVAEIRATLPEFSGHLGACRTDKMVTHGE